MLHDQHKNKIAQAISLLSQLISVLEGTPIDPRAVTLLDIACSYLEEQGESGIEYHQADDDDQDMAMHTCSPHQEEEQVASAMLSEIDEQAWDSPNFKLLGNQKPDGDAIAEEIQEWYKKLDEEQEI